MALQRVFRQVPSRQDARAPPGIRICQIADDSFCIAGMTLSASPVDPHTATPRILIRLRGVERKHESVSADGGLVLNWPFDRAGRKGPWLFADLVSCNAAARAAWRLSEPSDLPSLVYLAKADPSFSGMLAMVALSVAAPQGGALQMQPEPRLTFRPKPEHASLVPGEWCFDTHASIRGAERDGDRVLCIMGIACFALS